jgi:micrococcal nuclease
MECGKFKQAPGSEPSNQQKRQAQQRQPNQGQFYWLTQDSPGSTDGSDSGSDDSGPGYVAPTQEPEPAPASTDNCDPSYPGVCIPPRSQVGDLDCRDISDRRFQVIPPDPHNFDGDFDGIGCEGE